MATRRDSAKGEESPSPATSRRKSPHPPKIENIRDVVQVALNEGRYRFSPHVLDRMRQRSITQMDIKEILRGGRHEKSRDRFDEILNSWSYSFRGKLEDGRDLRVPVSKMKNGILIISAIDLSKGNDE